MAWETVPPPNYAAFDNSSIVGNALGKYRQQLSAGAAGSAADAGERPA